MVLDAHPEGIIYRDLIPEYVRIARTIYEGSGSRFTYIYIYMYAVWKDGINTTLMVLACQMISGMLQLMSTTWTSELECRTIKSLFADSFLKVDIRHHLLFVL